MNYLVAIVYGQSLASLWSVSDQSGCLAASVHTERHTKFVVQNATKFADRWYGFYGFRLLFFSSNCRLHPIGHWAIFRFCHGTAPILMPNTRLATFIRVIGASPSNYFDTKIDILKCLSLFVLVERSWTHSKNTFSSKMVLVDILGDTFQALFQAPVLKCFCLLSRSTLLR